MRLAVTIIGIILSAFMFIQSFAIYALADTFAPDHPLHMGGALGIIAAILCLIGSALAIGVPTGSMVVLAFGGLSALFAWQNQFSDMLIYFIALFILLWMERFGRQQKRDEEDAVAAELARQQARDYQLTQLLATQRHGNTTPVFSRPTAPSSKLDDSYPTWMIPNRD